MVKAFVVAVALLATCAVQAQTRFTMVDEPTETIRDEADVSARAVVIGAVRHWRQWEAAATSLDAILADIPAGWADDPVCLALVTQDGLYEYRSTLRAPEDWDGDTPVELDFAPSVDLLDRYEVGDVALLAGRGACDGALATLAPASLGTEGGARALEVELLVNSFRADEVHLVVGTPPDFEVATCTPLEQGSRVAFDHRCRVPLNAIDGPTPVQILRLRNQTPDPRVEIVLELP